MSLSAGPLKPISRNKIAFVGVICAQNMIQSPPKNEEKVKMCHSSHSCYSNTEKWVSVAMIATEYDTKS